MYLEMPTLPAGRSGLGAYPEDPYYDPKRPGWLPYWIDTPTESEAKYSFLYGVTPAAITRRPQEVYPVETLRKPPVPLAPPPGTVYKETVAITPAGKIWTPESTIDPAAFQRWWQTRELGSGADNGNGNGNGVSPWLVVALVIGGVGAVKLIRG